MKRIFILLVLISVLASSLFAQSYTVQNVTGRVQRESGGNKIDVRAGDTLTADTVVHTGVGAFLVLGEGDKTFTIPATRSGRIGELITAAAGVRVGGSVNRVDTSAVSRTTGQVSVASARAADVAIDKDINDDIDDDIAED